MPTQHPRKANGLTLSPEDFSFKRRVFHLAMTQMNAATRELRAMDNDANPAKVIRAAKRLSHHESLTLDVLLALADLDPSDRIARATYTEVLHAQIVKTIAGTVTVTEAVDTLVRHPRHEEEE